LSVFLAFKRRSWILFFSMLIMGGGFLLLAALLAALVLSLQGDLSLMEISGYVLRSFGSPSIFFRQ
jgi:hypothetical protein